ncbi:MAG: hypothetical protein IPM24_10845 [Bryobacterales bacterium]|nr:hypothetical protein [Bryobacterales bacterium]
MQAVDHLQRNYRIAINYEDPPFQFEGDIQDITDQVQNPRQRAANPNARIRVPRGGRLAMPHVPVRPGVVADALPAIGQLLSAYEGAGFPGRFRLLQEADALTVTPVALRTAQGEWTTVTSVLSAPVSFDRQERAAAEVLDEVLKQVSAARGVKVGLAWLPMGAFATTRVNLGADRTPAASVLRDLFREITTQIRGALVSSEAGVLLSYRLLFDPGVRYYMLTVAPVPMPPSPPETNQSGSFGGTFGNVPAAPPSGTLGSAPVKR